MMRNRIGYLFFCCLIVLLLLPLSSFIEVKNLQSQYVVVQVSGAVEVIESYSLPKRSTIGDVLKLAKLTKEADISQINQNIIVKDKDIIVIPYKKENQKVSINYSSLEELITLPRIGEKIAQRIIDYRNENGLFQKLDELKNVKGIGEKTFENLKELICL